MNCVLIAAIRQQGGIALKNGNMLVPEPILVGRNAQKLEALGARCGITRFSTDLAACLIAPDYQIYFDSQTFAHNLTIVTRNTRHSKTLV